MASETAKKLMTIDAEQRAGWVQRSASTVRCSRTRRLVYFQPSDARPTVPCPHCGGEHRTAQAARRRGSRRRALTRASRPGGDSVDLSRTTSETRQ